VPQLLFVRGLVDLVLQGRGRIDLDINSHRTMASFIGPYLATEIESEILETVAEAAFDVYAQARARVFPLVEFEAIAGSGATAHMIDTGVLVVIEETASFAHNLVHDYLAAYYLAGHDDRWDQGGFDAVSFRAASFDVLVIAAEILADRGDTERIEVFVQQMYDWNFYAVGFVLARCVDIGSQAIPHDMYIAVETMLAERRWDLVVATAKRVTNALHLIGDTSAHELLGLADLDELRAWVESQHGDATWFHQWRDLFLTPSGTPVDDEFVALISDPLSIRGWTAANVVKRTQPSDAAERQLRSYLVDGAAANSVRWRAAHALGAFPTPENSDLLFSVLTDDPNVWARYGAVRSLVEQAARTQDVDLRRQIIERLATKANVISEDPSLLVELSRCLVLSRPPKGWATELRPLLGELWNLSSGERQQLWEQIATQAEAYESDAWVA